MTANVSSILKYLDNDNKNFLMEHIVESPPRAKKRRLDHLSWEEKLQRKKLKNRVAAQTSRDRKKAKMEQMEQALQQLFAKNETLIEEYKNIKKVNERLLEENEELRNRLQERCSNCSQNRTVGCKALNGSTESLLQPKGRAIHSAAALSKDQTLVLWKIVLSCLLYQTCLMNSKQTSTLTHWNNLHRAFFKISRETWKQLLRKQIVKNQLGMDKIVLKRWWGSHQRNWNPPVEAKC